MTTSSDSRPLSHGRFRAAFAALPEAIARLSFVRPTPAGPGAEAQGSRVIDVELARSRRYERPFVLARVPPRPGSAGALAGALRDLLRSVDRVWEERDGVYLLLPESGPETASRLLARIAEPLAALLPERAVVTFVTFPRDGLTQRALRAALAARAAAPPRGDPLRPAPALGLARGPALAAEPVALDAGLARAALDAAEDARERIRPQGSA
jgi:hypothetical protein